MKLGEVVTVNYIVTNLSARETVGQAAYNVTPLHDRRLLQQDQLLLLHRAASQARREARNGGGVLSSIRRWPRTPNCDDLNTITLSYTFYPVREPVKPVADRGHEIGDELTNSRLRAPPRDGMETRRWPTRTPSRTTTTIWSTRARGRSSARCRPSCWRSALISWMHHLYAAAPLVFAAGALGVLYTMLGWWRDVIKEARVRGRPHPRGADLAPLRHDPVHRLRGDVLRRLVLGLFRHRAVPGRRPSGRAHRTARRRLAADSGHSRPSIRGICRCSTR